MHVLLRSLILIALCAAGACNKYEPTIGTPVSPTPPVSLTPPNLPPPNQPDVATLDLKRSYVHAGYSLQGVVNLLGRAPETGASVALVSSDSAAIVPATVRIAAGERSAAFTLTTLPVAGDRQLLITAKTAGGSAVASLAVFSEFPTFYTWTSEPGEFIGEDGFNRLTACCAEFSAVCDRNEVRIEVTAQEPEAWSMLFRAPNGAPLRAGTYENVTDEKGGSNATMVISGLGRSCSGVNGRFTVREINLEGNRVNRFRVSFEQRCTNGDPDGWLRGEVGLTNVPAPSPALSCQR